MTEAQAAEIIRRLTAIDLSLALLTLIVAVQALGFAASFMVRHK